MLKSIETSGYKNQHFTRNLSGLDLFTSGGKNGVGKSSNLEAALLLTLGYLPNGGNGNTVEGVLKYSTKGGLSVSGVFQNGSEHKITRIFSATAKNKRRININGEDLPYAEGHEKINKLLGFLPMMVDISEFMKMSDNKKKEFILRFSPEGVSWTKVQFMFICRIKLIGSKIGEGVLKGLLLGIIGKKPLKDITTDEANKLVEALQSMVPTEYITGVDEIIALLEKKWNSAYDVQQNISALIGYVRQEVSHYTRKTKGNLAGMKKLNQTTGDMGSVTSSIGEIKISIKVLRSELTTVGKQLAADKEKVKAIDKRDKRIEELCTKIANLKANKDLLNHNNDELKAWGEEATTTNNEQREILAGIKTDIAVQKGFIEQHRKNLNNLTNNKGKCVLASDVNCNSNMLLSAHAETLGGNISNCEKRINEFKNRMELCNKAIIESSRTQKIYQDEIDLRLNKKTHETELSLLKTEETNDIGVADPLILETRKRSIDSQINQKTGDLGALEQQKGILVAQKEIHLEQANDEVKLILFKESAKVLGAEGIQGEIVEAIKKPLENEVNTILCELNNDMQFAIDLSSGFKMGWLREGRLIPFETLNQAHHVILVVAFLTAIINRMNPGLKLICIEAAELGTETLLMMLSGLAKLRESGRLDNVLVAHHQTISNERLPDGWSQHVLTEDKESVSG